MEGLRASLKAFYCVMKSIHAPTALSFLLLLGGVVLAGVTASTVFAQSATSTQATSTTAAPTTKEQERQALEAQLADLEKQIDENQKTIDQYQKQGKSLSSEIATLPASQRSKLELLVADTKKRHEQLRASAANVQESLDYLRVAIKYLLFDLEATRRENAYLRKMLQRHQDEK